MNTRERLRRWVDGELDAAEEAALMAEAARRPDLARAIEDARVVRVHVDALRSREPGTPPEDLVERSVRRAIRAREERDARPARWWDWLFEPVTFRVRVASVIGAAALVLGALLVPRAWFPTPHASESVAATRAVGPMRAVASATRSAAVDASALGDRATTSHLPLEPSAVPVRFVLPARGARSVAVAGDFNRWQPDGATLRDEDGDGVFVGTLRLPSGTYAYMFVVDGERWVSDPYATNLRDDGFGHQNAVLRIAD